MSKKTERELIISSVKSPLGFFALIVLFVEIILTLLLFASDVNRLSIAIGMAAVFVGLLLAAAMIIVYRPHALYAPKDFSSEKEFLELDKLKREAEEKRIQLEIELVQLKLKAVRKELEALSISEKEKEELAKKLREIISTDLKVFRENGSK
jgi:cell shape-determining protein MreC